MLIVKKIVGSPLSLRVHRFFAYLPLLVLPLFFAVATLFVNVKKMFHVKQLFPNSKTFSK